VLAERFAAAGHQNVLLVDRRPHVGGNAYDRHNAARDSDPPIRPRTFSTPIPKKCSRTCRASRHGGHTSIAFACRLTDRLVPMPINRATLNLLYGLRLETEADAAAYLAKQAEPCETLRTSEDVVVSSVGRDLYERFFRGYTRKQWGLDPSQLDKSVAARVPARTTTDDRYFTDKIQAMPRQGFTRMFENMLDHPKIRLELGVDFRATW